MLQEMRLKHFWSGSLSCKWCKYKVSKLNREIQVVFHNCVHQLVELSKAQAIYIERTYPILREDLFKFIYFI